MVIKYILNVVLDDCFIYNIIVNISTMLCPLSKKKSLGFNFKHHGAFREDPAKPTVIWTFSCRSSDILLSETSYIRFVCPC